MPRYYGATSIEVYTKYAALPDNKGRPVYSVHTAAGIRLYVDADHRAWRHASIYPKQNNDFNGEPDEAPIHPDTALEFIPYRKVRELSGPQPYDRVRL